jgi:hypothetical protein
MQTALGNAYWAVAPAASEETLEILNTSELEAHLEIALYFSDREPAAAHSLRIPARRQESIGWKGVLASNADGARFSAVIKSDVPVIVFGSNAYAVPEPRYMEDLTPTR